MAIFPSFTDVFKKNHDKIETTEWETLWDLEFADINSKRAYLKRMAIDRVVNFVARSFSTTEFRYVVDEQEEINSWTYLLNVKPNKDLNAVDFWHRVIFKLLTDNEVLIIKSDDDQLLIADDFVRNEYAVYEDTFQEVTVKDYTFKRSFEMNEVIYLEYSNRDLDEFITGLYADYGELFGRMLEIQLRNNQIRGIVDIDMTTAFNNKVDKDGLTAQQKIQNFIDKLFTSFKSNSVAIVPKTKGFEYQEVSASTRNASQSVEEMIKLKRDLADEVAGYVGVPTGLVFGEGSEKQLEAQQEIFLEFCLTPLIDKVQSELTNKLITQTDYLNGHRIDLVGMNKLDIFKRAVQIDKLVSSGTFTRNEIRKRAKYFDIEGGDEVLITKNYEQESNLKGGDDE